MDVTEELLSSIFLFGRVLRDFYIHGQVPFLGILMVSHCVELESWE
jgi:hypothetical protein